MSSLPAFLQHAPLRFHNQSHTPICRNSPKMITVNQSPADASRPSTDTKGATISDSSILFGRVVTAMVTPFKRGTAEVDYTTAAHLATYLVDNGSDALVIAGTTGESPTLKWSEQYELFNVIRDTVGDRAKLIAGAGSNSTAEAIEATRAAKRVGLDGTLQVVPYYNKPPQEGLYQHFRAIAEAEPELPIMLYNIPGRTGVCMSTDVIERLSQIDNIVALKQATDDLDDFVEIRKATSSDFHIYSGDDSRTLPFLSLGGTGVVSVASHFVGLELQEMVRKFVNGDVKGANEIHMKYFKLFTDLFCMTNPIPTKTALRLQGWTVGGVRLPLVDAPPEVETKVSTMLKELNLL